MRYGNPIAPVGTTHIFTLEDCIFEFIFVQFEVFTGFLTHVFNDFFTLFAVAIAAAETAIAIAIIINIYRNIRNINVDNVDKMKY